MSHIDFTRWKPDQPPSLHEIIKLAEAAEAELGSFLRSVENITITEFCNHELTNPDLFSRSTVPFCRGYNIDWINPAQPDHEHPGMAVLQVTYEELSRPGSITTDNFINPRQMLVWEAMNFTSLLSTGVFPRSAGISWIPVDQAGPIPPGARQSWDHHE